MYKAYYRMNTQSLTYDEENDHPQSICFITLANLQCGD